MNEEILFRNIYQHIQVPIFVINVEAAGDFIFGGLNPACEKATGLRNEDVVGKRPEEIPDLPKEGAVALRANCARCLEAKNVIHCEEPFVGRGQGTWWQTQLAPVRDGAGKIVQIIGFSVDIKDLKRAEEALRESELRYREVFENISDCIFILDVNPDGRFKFAEFNPAEEKSVGYSTSEVSGRFIEEVVPAELAKQVTSNYRRCLEAGTLISYDEEISLPVGRRFFNTVLIPVRNATGEIYRIMGVARDITEQRKAEKALLESETRVRRKLDAILSPQSDLGMLELSDIIDSEKIQKLMDEFYNLTKIGIGIIDLKGRVLVGTGWQDICTEFHRKNPESCQLCIESDLELSRNVSAGTFKLYRCKNNMWDIATPIMLGDKHVGNIFLGQFLFDDEVPEYEVFRKQAKLYGFNEKEYMEALDRVPRWSRETVNAAMSFYISLAQMIGNLSYSSIKLANTLEERKRAEAALKESEARYIDLYENAPDMYASVNARTASIEKCNQILADMLGRTKDEIIGRPVFEIYHPDCLDQARDLFQEFLERGEIHDKELQLRRKDGSKIDISLNVTSIRDEHGHILYSRSTLRDITGRKRIDNIMQARLRLLEFANTHSMDELLTATLDEIEALTGNSIGFYHFLEADQKTLSLQSWSTNTLKNMCTAAGRGSHYDIAQAGVWVDCVHERRAVIHNDYASLPHRKGMPEGHAPVIRELVVPIIRGDLIKAIVGVGNKPTNYDEGDVDILSQLGDLSWDIVERMQTEEALKESEERYRLLFRRSPVGVFHYDTQLHITDCNDRFAAILQSSRERLVGLDMKTLRDQSVLSALRQAAEGEDGFYEGFYRATTSSAEIWVSMRTAPLVDLQGQVKGGIGIVEDITERKQAEDALRRSENEKAILNQIASIFLTVPDEAMYGEVLAVVLQVMKSKFGIFGYIGEDGDLVTPSLTKEIWSECQVPGKSIVFPSDSWGTSLWGRAIREKKAFCSNGPFRTPEGHIHIDHFLAVPIVYGQETIGLISVANKEGGYAEEDKDFLERIVSRVSPILNARLQRDAQERRRMAAEKDLRESEEKYRLLITNAGEAIFIVQDDAVKFPNPKALEMSGYSTEELASIPFIDLIHPSDKEAVLEGYLKLLEGKQPEPYPFRIIDKKGKERWVELTTAPIIWDKKSGILCFLRDVTDEKKLEAQLMQAQKTEAVGRLAGGVAHDFNNMLTVIIGNTEMALMDVASSDPLYARLQNVDNAARRSADLTRQLLAFARKQTISPKVLNLNDTVSGMLEMLRRLIGEDIDLAWRPWAELWPVMMDPSQIDQVLANLCVNARDAIAGVGKVTVETGNIALDEDYCATHPDFIPGEYVLLAVSDDGCGMDQETRAHLFEPFFTTKGVGKGTGLGLATVYGIVKQNDGFINVYSEPGQGTTFKIYFPRHKAEPAGALVETAAETPPGGRETVLMVEDEKAILDLGKSILEKLGYAVLIAKTPGEAIRLVEEHTDDIHLVLADVVMPEMNGRDLAERLASIKPSLKCLYMSGYTANVIAHRGVLEEGVHFIEKPFSMKDLAAKVRKVLDSK